MRKLLFVILIALLPISAFAKCEPPRPCPPSFFESCFDNCCNAKYYVKPAYSYSRRELGGANFGFSSSNNLTHSSGGSISIGFVEPWTSFLSWGLEAGYGSFGKDNLEAFPEVQTITTDTVITSPIFVETRTVSQNLFVAETINRYSAFDLAAVLYLHCGPFSVFGKAGFAHVLVSVDGNTVTNLGPTTTMSTVDFTTTTINTDRSLVFTPVQQKFSDTVPFVGLGFDYCFTPHISAGLELIHINGSTSISPIDSLQLYVRLLS